MEKSIVAINKKIASNTRMVEVNGDIIVPDIKPDIVSVINTNANSYIYKEEVLEGRIRVDGNIDAYIVYLADNGENRSIQTTLNFVENIESEEITSSSISKEKVSIESIEAKVLNERKLSIKANLMIRTEVFENSQIEIANDFEEIADLQKLRETVEIKSIIGMNKVKTSIKEDIKVDNGYEVAEILKTSIELENYENKISYNKVLAKADANIKIIFLAEDGKIGLAQSTIPVMSFIDIDKVIDTNICNVEYSIRNMLFKANNKEMHSITCQVDFEVFCEAYESKKIDVIQDMYGIRQNIEFSKKDVEVEISKTCPEEKVNLNEKILLEDVMNVLDLDCRPRVVTANKFGKSYNYECEMDITAYYEADNKNGLNVKSVQIPFIVKLEASDEQIEFNMMKKEFTISGENVDINMEILVKEKSTNMKRISIIENAETKEAEEESDYKMFLYFVKAGDTIWNIAKKFRVSMEEVIKLNNLENPEKINVGDCLYIMR